MKLVSRCFFSLFNFKILISLLISNEVFIYREREYDIILMEVGNGNETSYD